MLLLFELVYCKINVLQDKKGPNLHKKLPAFISNHDNEGLLYCFGSSSICSAFFRITLD